MVPVVTQGEAFTASRPTKLFTASYLRNAPWEVSADGRRFLVLKQAESSPVNAQLNVVTNWVADLQRVARAAQ